MSQFHGEAHHDFVLINSEPPFFGLLLYIFTFCIDETHYPLTLIKPYEVIPLWQRPLQDKELGLLRVRCGKPPEFIFLCLVICGALVVGAESSVPKDRLVVDVVDEDMFIHIKRMFPTYTDTPKPFRPANHTQ